MLFFSYSNLYFSTTVAIHPVEKILFAKIAVQIWLDREAEIACSTRDRRHPKSFAIVTISFSWIGNPARANGAVTLLLSHGALRSKDSKHVFIGVAREARTRPAISRQLIENFTVETRNS
jgi:hypothetical protein